MDACGSAGFSEPEWVGEKEWAIAHIFVSVGSNRRTERVFT